MGSVPSKSAQQRARQGDSGVSAQQVCSAACQAGRQRGQCPASLLSSVPDRETVGSVPSKSAQQCARQGDSKVSAQQCAKQVDSKASAQPCAKQVGKGVSAQQVSAQQCAKQVGSKVSA